MIRDCTLSYKAPLIGEIMSEGFPFAGNTTVHFAHIAYRMEDRYDLRNPEVNYFQSWTAEDTMSRIEEADVFVCSGLWDNALLERASKLKYIQSVGAGYDQFPLDELRDRGIRLANASGVNQNAVAEHAGGQVQHLGLDLRHRVHAGPSARAPRLPRRHARARRSARARAQSRHDRHDRPCPS